MEDRTGGEWRLFDGGGGSVGLPFAGVLELPEMNGIGNGPQNVHLPQQFSFAKSSWAPELRAQVVLAEFSVRIGRMRKFLYHRIRTDFEITQDPPPGYDAGATRLHQAMLVMQQLGL